MAPSTSSCQVLQQNHHAPVTCLAWDPSGRILLSASPVDTSLMAWDVPMETCIPLRRLGGGGVSLLRWSPDGSKVFSATPSQLFRVWETRTWTCEVWTKCTSRCKAACWSPDGRTLLFATENEPIIYSLTFSTNIDDTSTVIGGSQSAVVSVSLAEVDLKTEDGETTKVGGLVQSMVMDRHGERLAVTLHDDKGQVLPYVALFRTRTNPMLEITPCGLVQGETGEYPLHVSFQPSFDRGALLSVVWSSGTPRYVHLNVICYRFGALVHYAMFISMLSITDLELLYTTLCSSQCYLLQIWSSGTLRYVHLSVICDRFGALVHYAMFISVLSVTGLELRFGALVWCFGTLRYVYLSVICDRFGALVWSSGTLRYVHLSVICDKFGALVWSSGTLRYVHLNVICYRFGASVWSSGTLRYVSLYFIPSDEIQNAQYQQPAPPTLNGNILSLIARHTWGNSEPNGGLTENCVSMTSEGSGRRPSVSCSIRMSVKEGNENSAGVGLSSSERMTYFIQP
ncbi:aladin-like [Crassostrea virginica]